MQDQAHKAPTIMHKSRLGHVNVTFQEPMLAKEAHQGAREGQQHHQGTTFHPRLKLAKTWPRLSKLTQDTPWSRLDHVLTWPSPNVTHQVQGKDQQPHPSSTF
ncbi:hypothetical protein PIB30_069634 [Stylosanthes scabra]|uniref:Uncharacterized protein n=1 Tax=Stylosanthes scabra TaxID=79078 RepID=A0ABU6RN80_9FABA|nr:hypothetical protein [Stylosanthes scabra]